MVQSVTLGFMHSAIIRQTVDFRKKVCVLLNVSIFVYVLLLTHIYIYIYIHEHTNSR